MVEKIILMDRDKVLRKIGDSVGLIFNKEEQNLCNLVVGEPVKVTLKQNKYNRKSEGEQDVI